MQFNGLLARIYVTYMTYKCHICLKIGEIERRMASEAYRYTESTANQGTVMSQKKLVKQLLKKLDKLESDREKLIDKLAKALDKLDKKVAAKKAPAKKVPAKKVAAKKVAAKKTPTKKTPARKAPAKKVAAKKTAPTKTVNADQAS